MAPADQRLGADQPLRGGVELGLQEQFELLLRDRHAQVAFELGAMRRAHPYVFGEGQDRVVVAACLGQHGDQSALDLLAVAGLGGRQQHAAMQPGGHFLAFDQERPLAAGSEHRLHALDRRRHVFAGRIGEQEGIVAGVGEQRIVRHQRAQARADGRQQVVAEAPATGIVEVAEAVDVGHHQHVRAARQRAPIDRRNACGWAAR
jgi:hypothetical protein